MGGRTVNLWPVRDKNHALDSQTPFSFSPDTLVNSSDNDTPNACDILSIFLSDGFRTPRSIPLMYVRWRLHRNASSSCVNPLDCRSFLSVVPNSSQMFSIIFGQWNEGQNHLTNPF